MPLSCSAADSELEYTSCAMAVTMRVNSKRFDNAWPHPFTKGTDSIKWCSIDSFCLRCQSLQTVLKYSWTDDVWLNCHRHRIWNIIRFWKAKCRLLNACALWNFAYWFQSWFRSAYQALSLSIWHSCWYDKLERSRLPTLYRMNIRNDIIFIKQVTIQLETADVLCGKFLCLADARTTQQIFIPNASIIQTTTAREKKCYHFTYSLWRCAFCTTRMAALVDATLSRVEHSLHLLNATSIQLHWIAVLSCVMRNVSMHFMRSNTFQVFQAEERTMSLTPYTSLLCGFFGEKKCQKHDTGTHFICRNSILFDRLLKRVRIFNFAIFFNYWIQFHFDDVYKNNVWKELIFWYVQNFRETFFLLLLLCNNTDDGNGAPLHKRQRNWCALNDLSLLCRQDFLSVTNDTCWELLAKKSLQIQFKNVYTIWVTGSFFSLALVFVLSDTVRIDSNFKSPNRWLSFWSMP